MFKFKPINTLLLIISTTLLFSCNQQTDFVPNSNNFELSVTLNLNEDIGQKGGTIFQIKSPKGNLIACAGFNNGVNTRSSANNRLLSYFVQASKDTAIIKDIGKPFPDIIECGRIYNVNNELWALSYDHQKKRYNTKTNTWDEIADKNFSTSGFLTDIQSFGNNLIYVYTNKILINDSMLYQEELEGYSIIGFAINDGKVLIFRNAPYNYIENQRNIITIGQLHHTNKQYNINILKHYEGYCPDPTLGGVYSWAYKDEYFYVATNAGHLYKLNEKSFEAIHNVDIYDTLRESWQVYAMINYYDELLLGHYPSGDLLSIENNKIKEPKKIFDIPAHPNVLDESREAQSMAIYSGALFCGLWPWGEVYMYKKNRWRLLNRFFESPFYNNQIAPYADRMHFNTGEYNNQWGQRITDLVPFEKYLAVNTSFKNTISEIDKKFIFKKEYEEYGKVYLVEIPYQLTANINYKPSTEFKFICKNNKLSIFQDDELLAETEINIKSKSCIIEIMPENGIYGTSDFELVSYTLN
jgi:hypothetical protein